MSLTIVELTCVITLLGNKRTSCHSELFQFQIYFKTKVVSGMTVTQIDRSQLDLDHVYWKVKVIFFEIDIKKKLPIVEMDALTKTLLIPISSILKKDSNNCATGFWMITTANNKWLVSKIFAVMVSHDFYLVIYAHFSPNFKARGSPFWPWIQNYKCWWPYSSLSICSRILPAIFELYLA